MYLPSPLGILDSLGQGCLIHCSSCLHLSKSLGFESHLPSTTTLALCLNAFWAYLPPPFVNLPLVLQPFGWFSQCSGSLSIQNSHKLEVSKFLWGLMYWGLEIHLDPYIPETLQVSLLIFRPCTGPGGIGAVTRLTKSLVSTWNH